MLANKVISINVDSVSNAIDVFIEEQNCINTVKTYKRTIIDFFNFNGVDMYNVNWGFITSLNYKHSNDYKKHLMNSYKNSTVNQKMACLKSLFKHLQKFNSQVNPAIMDVKKLNEDNKASERGAFTEEELNELFDFCLEQRKGLVKQMYFKTLYQTGLRKQAVLNLKWNDIKQKLDSTTGKMVWTIYTVNDKGSEHIVSISDRFYEELLTIKENSERIFDISKNTIDAIIPRFVRAYNIDTSRNICIHSIKKTSVDKVVASTGNILTASKHAKHASPNTTIKHYQGKNESLTEQASYYAFEEVDLSNLENLSKEELIEAIKRSGSFVQNQILKNI